MTKSRGGNGRRNRRQQGAHEKANVQKNPLHFFPRSPKDVFSPNDAKNQFCPRPVRQRTPRKLCTLVLPPPLVSLFDNAATALTVSGGGGGGGGIGGNVGGTTNSIASAISADSFAASRTADGGSLADDHSALFDAAAAGGGGGPPHSSTARHGSSVSVSASVTGSTSGGGAHPLLPPHLRVGMAPCDPLIVFEGRYVLVATSDGRLAVYSILDFGPNSSRPRTVCGHKPPVYSEDVEASERRRRADWEGQDAREQQEGKYLSGRNHTAEGKKDASKDHTRNDTNREEDLSDLEEESEWETRERMHRRESAKETVSPIFILSLPKNTTRTSSAGFGSNIANLRNKGNIHPDDKNNNNIAIGSGGPATEEEEKSLNSSTLSSPPSIVGMCATPGVGVSLFSQHYATLSSDGSLEQTPTETTKQRSQVVATKPTFGKSLLGNVVVLTEDGEVHVLEFLSSSRSNVPPDCNENELKRKMPDSDADGANSVSLASKDERVITKTNNKICSAPYNQILVVNVVLSFSTGILGATCICIYPTKLDPTINNFTRHDGVQKNTKSNHPLDNNSDADKKNDSKCPENNPHSGIAHQSKQQLRLCIGHESGILTNFHLVCTFTQPGIKKKESSSAKVSHTAAYSRSPSCDTTVMSNMTPKQSEPASSTATLVVRHLSNETRPVAYDQRKTFLRSRSSEYQRHTLTRASSTGSSSSAAVGIGGGGGSVDDNAVLVSPTKSSLLEICDKAAPSASFTPNHSETTTIHRNISNPKDSSITTTDTCELPSKESEPMFMSAQAILCWRGRIDAPIRSLSCPGWGTRANSQTQNSHIGEGDNHHADIIRSLVVIGVTHHQPEADVRYGTMNGLNPDPSSSEYRHHLSPALSLEVINASLAETFWGRMEGSPEKAIPLSKCTVWPAAGMEIKDRRIEVRISRENDSKDSFFRILGLQRVIATDKISCFQESSPCFFFAASDGTVGIVHCNKKGSWGITHQDNQIMLWQKCIGIGAVDYGTVPSLKLNAGDHSVVAPRYIVCCLRGGSIYVVPVVDQIGNPGKESVSMRSNPENDITLLAIPTDSAGEDDATIRFVQNFTSGMVRVVSWKDGTSRACPSSLNDPTDGTILPVAVVGWPGGTADVYEIIPEGPMESCALFEQVAENETVIRLVEHLLSIDKSNPIITSDVWRAAWDECNNAKNVLTVTNGIKDTSNEKFDCIRSLLLSLI